MRIVLPRVIVRDMWNSRRASQPGAAARSWGLLCPVQMSSAGLDTPTAPTGQDAGVLSSRKTPAAQTLMPVECEPASISEQHLKDVWQAVRFSEDAVFF